METVQEVSTPAVSKPVHTERSLVIHAGFQSYTWDERDAPIVIGRESPAQIIIDDDRISRAHVRIDHTPTGWVAVDQSRNGIYMDGVQQPAISIRDGMTIHLGHPQGIPVAFGNQLSALETDPDATDEDEDETEQFSVTDPGIARAGVAVAARRDELKLTQRSLARDGIVNAGALIGFEKGRRWPRMATRTKIEDALQWPRGHIARIRREGNAADAKSTEIMTNTVRAPLMVEAVEVALMTINAAIESLPEPADPAFSARTGPILADLRRLESIAANAAHSTMGAPEVALTLSVVRKRYRDLMLRAARAQGATLGQRLYATRCRAELSVEEIANAAGVPVDAVTAAEAEVPLDAKTVTALSAALSVLTRR